MRSARSDLEAVGAQFEAWRGVRPHRVAKGRRKRAVARRAFVEVPPLTLAPPAVQAEALDKRCECRVVLESATGARLSVEFARVDPAWLGSVCRMLLDAGATVSSAG